MNDIVGNGQGHGARQLIQATFADVVSGYFWNGHHRIHRTHVHDGATASGFHGAGL
jgi:hypothetical protein